MATPVMIDKFNIMGTTTTGSKTVQGTYVVTNITIVNPSSHSNQFSIFRTPANEVSANGVFQDDCRVYKQITVGAGDTTVLSNLKWVLSNGDAIGVQKHTGLIDRDLIFYIDGIYIG